MNSAHSVIQLDEAKSQAARRAEWYKLDILISFLAQGDPVWSEMDGWMESLARLGTILLCAHA